MKHLTLLLTRECFFGSRPQVLDELGGNLCRFGLEAGKGVTIPLDILKRIVYNGI